MLNQPANNPFGGTFDKIDVILHAYSQLRISGITVTPTPGDLELALDRLETMAHEWALRNINAGWNFENHPDPNTDSGVQRGYKQAFETNLAVRLIPDFNKQVPDMLMRQAAQSLGNLSGRSAYANIKGVTYPSRQALGSGNTLRRARWNRFYGGYRQNSASIKRLNMFIGDINDYVEYFDAWLKEGEILTEVAFEVDSGLRLISEKLDPEKVEYKVEAMGSGGYSNSEGRQLTIIVKTDAGRVETRIIYFAIVSRPWRSDAE